MHIQSHLQERGLAMSKVTGLGTDGASNMTGKKEGLAGHGNFFVISLCIVL